MCCCCSSVIGSQLGNQNIINACEPDDTGQNDFFPGGSSIKSGPRQMFRPRVKACTLLMLGIIDFFMLVASGTVSFMNKLTAHSRFLV